jgi:hypothetical protein
VLWEDCVVDDQQQRRVARNETLLREVNDGIEEGLRAESRRERVRFRCECASLDCNEAVELTIGEYERIRQHPRRFVLVGGHELAEVESVVETGPGYVVVQKRGPAGATAEKLDPRD